MAGFFRLFRGGGSGQVEPIPLGDLEEWLEGRLKAEFRNVYAQGNAIRLRVKEAALKVGRVADELSQMEVKEDDLNRPLLQTILNARDRLANRAADSASRLDLPEVGSFEDLVRCREATAQTLGQIKQASTTHGRVMASFMRRGFRRLLGEVKGLQGEVDRLSSLVESVKGRAVEADALRSKVKVLKGLMVNVSDRSSSAVEAQRRLGEVEAEEGGLADELDALHGSEEFKTSSRTAQEEVRLEEEIRSFRAEFDTFFSALKRPFEKYLHTVQLSRDEERMLWAYMESPSEALMADRELAIRRSLKDLKGAVDGGVVTVKDPEKIVRRIDRLEQILGERREKILSLLMELESMREALNSSLMGREEELRRRLEEKRREREKWLGVIERERGEAEDSLRRAEEMSADIEEKIQSLLGCRVKITDVAVSRVDSS